MFFNYSSFRPNFQTKKAGFTIYPLVLVIIIISVSFSYFTPFYAKQKLGIVAEEVISQTNYLRFRALIDQTRYSMQFENIADKVNLKVERYSPYGLNLFVYDPNFSYNINSTGKVFFYPNGRASPRTISIQRGEHTKKITISLEGRIKLQ